MSRPRLLVVSPRPPRHDGQGDQRRAHTALTALSRDWDVDVVSWLPDAGELHDWWRTTPGRAMRAAALSAVRPLHVAYVQAAAPPRLARVMADYDLTLLVTNRSAPRSISGPYAIDFIDDLGGAATQRADNHPGVLGPVWRWQSRRLRRLDSELAAGAVLSTAVTAHDAAAISPRVTIVPMAMATKPMTEVGTKVVFAGNLFYAPNAEAVSWICTALVPRLSQLGIDPADVVVAGRRPSASLRAQARSVGIDLRPDVPDLTAVLCDAAVVVAPVRFGSGVQTKVLDAVGAGRACVVSSFANQALGLVDGRSALVRERTVEAFADAVVALLGDSGLRRKLSAAALEQFRPYEEEAVHEVWRTCFAEVRSVVTARR